MKPHPRIRKTIKWGGAAVTVLLLVMWIGSAWWYVAWFGARHIVGVAMGRLNVAAMDVTQLEISLGVRFDRVPAGFSLEWWPEWKRMPVAWSVAIPVWMLAAAALGVTVWAWRQDAIARCRARTWLCFQCRYDRTGLAAGAKCPECGSEPEGNAT